MIGLAIGNSAGQPKARPEKDHSTLIMNSKKAMLGEGQAVSKIDWF